MLRSYLAIALRVLVAQKLYAAINIAGLAVGLACVILIGLFVRYELGYDGRWADAERIYRISRDYFESAETSEAHPAGMPGAAAPLLLQDFPQIETAARIFCCGAAVRTEDGEPRLERGYADADNSLFEIFDFEWLAGDPATALTEPNHYVLTRSAALRHFGDANPIGQTILIGGSDWLTGVVVGVIEDLPDDTHLDFDILGSMLSWTSDENGARYLNDWGNDVFYTYVKLREGADIADVEAKSADFIERHLGNGASAWTGFTATPIVDIHLRSNRENELWPPANPQIAGNTTTIYGATAIAVFILILACINFTNLCTARAAQRAKEVGVRKTLGARRSGLCVQFLAESALLTFIAMIVAFSLAELALPSFSAFLMQRLSLLELAGTAAVFGLLALLLGTAGAAGAYPALYLSAYRPSRVLKGDTTREGGSTLRRGLVVFQFAISIALMIATAIVYQQMRFARDVDLGFDKDGIIVVYPTLEFESLEQAWLAHPEITHVTTSDLVPFEQTERTAEVRSAESPVRAQRMPFLRVGFGFFETYGIDIVAGRAFSEEFATDRPIPQEDGNRVTRPFVISEMAARELGWTAQEAIGKWLEFGAIQNVRSEVAEAEGPIVGVASDVLFSSVRTAAEPMVYAIEDPAGAASIRVSGRNLTGTLAHIDEVWKERVPLVPIGRRFLAQDFETLYLAEERQALMLTVFASLAALIACLGLVGLAAFATERRTKEIGVRKAVGGSTRDIVTLFAREFVKLVLIANVIAWPVAYFAMRRWLDGFAYRIDISVLVFAACGAVALALAAIAVGAVAARAASAKPIKALRYE